MTQLSMDVGWPKSIRREGPLLHVCYAPSDRAWVQGRMLPALGLVEGQYRTREDDELGAMQLEEIERAVEECRFTVLVASSAARWDRLTQLAASLAQHAGLEDATPRLVIVTRDFTPGSKGERSWLSLAQRALVGLDCSDEVRTVEAMVRLRKLLALEEPIDERPPCPYPGLERFTAANRELLFGRDRDKQALLQRIRGCHTRILVVGPSGSGKSSLIHAALLPELSRDHVVQVVPRGGALVPALRTAIDALGVPGLGEVLDQYAAAVRYASDAQIEQARAVLRTAAVVVRTPIHDLRRRVIVIDPLEEIFAEDDDMARETLFAMLGGLWSLPWCTVILAMRADFYGALMVERCWGELERSQYPVAPLDELGLRSAIVEPAASVGVHVDPVLVERLIREIDRDRSSVPLPLLQVALKELWARLRWRYLMLADYERIVNQNQRGLAAVLAVHADGVVQALTAPGDGAVSQRILLDLVHLGEGRPHTRRRRTIQDLRRSGDPPEQLERVLEQLVAGRLITTSDGDQAATRGDGESAEDRYVDLAHDTLITGWPALARWVAERRDDLRTQRRLEARAAGGGVLSASELPEFSRWLATPAGRTLGASDALRALVRRSIAARRVRRGAFAAGLTVATAFAIIFGLQTKQLREEQARTQQKERERVREQEERERVTAERNDISKKRDLVSRDLSERDRQLQETQADLFQEQITANENAEQAVHARRRANETAQAYESAQDSWSEQRDNDRANYQREQHNLVRQWDNDRASCQRAYEGLVQQRKLDQTNCQKAHEDLVQQRKRDQTSYQHELDQLAKQSRGDHASCQREIDQLAKQRQNDRSSCQRELSEMTRHCRR